MLIFIIILFFVLLYLLIVLDEPNKKEKIEEKEPVLPDSALVFLVHADKYFLKVNEGTGNLYLDPSQGEVFRLVKKEEDPEENNKAHSKVNNRIGLESTTYQGYIMINCTAYHNDEYEVNMNACTVENNAAQLKLMYSKRMKNYYIKFYNNYYLSVDKNGNIYAHKNKKNVLYFDIKK